MMAMRAAKMGVKGSEAAWAFMIDRANSPRPRIRFSPNSSGITCLMLAVLTWREGQRQDPRARGESSEVSSPFSRATPPREPPYDTLSIQLDCKYPYVLTLLMRPLIDFLSASQLNLWNSAEALSWLASICIALNLAGGTYAPPLRLDCINLANSAAESNPAAVDPAPAVVMATAVEVGPAEEEAAASSSSARRSAS